MRRQRSLQKGRHFDMASQATGLLQVGQGTMVGLLGSAWLMDWTLSVRNFECKNSSEDAGGQQEIHISLSLLWLAVLHRIEEADIEAVFVAADLGE